MDKLLVITGPTATGKTALAVECAKALGGEVLSADSMQLYRGMDIGTAKVTPAEMQGVPHHLIDVAEPSEDWSVSRWTEAAEKITEDLLARGRVPVVAGGTGLYIDSLLAGRDFAESGDGALRARLGAEYDRLGGDAFREKLREIDPERAEKLAPADKKRLVRAMEVYALTGETITAHDARTRERPPRRDSLRVALTYRDRGDLYDRIDRRVDDMVRYGLFDEVEGLLLRGLSPDCTAMQAIGYKEIADCCRGLCTPGEAIDRIKLASRRYAKRQLTWLRRDPALHWIEWDGAPDISSACAEVLALWSGDKK